MVSTAAPERVAVTVERSDAGATVRVGEALFTEYRTDEGNTPCLWPIHGPSGHAMTRSWPLGERGEMEKDDHPHHRSLWFAHGGVNGRDFWHGGGTKVVHREFTKVESVDGVAVIEAQNDWIADGEVLLRDRTKLTFGLVEPATAESPWYVDYEIELIASEGPVTFGDTKEGTFAVRVPGVMKLDAGRGGRVRNSASQTDGAAWGRPAAWVDYSGPLTTDIDGPRGGVAIFAHPDSFRPTPRWHVRGYGLFAANPFGAVDFPEDEPMQGAVTIDAGESLTLRYRVVFYAGEVEQERLAAWNRMLSDQ